ncbi:uncharacterized protein LOC143878909 isoform X2 [Tasmannia lanceolata]|uniref:uncharacterized protein LOC143878909 isoform X2 n=1 Tax=Tasmannia lanceolata TaxID=3420 RepID=UPI0040641B1A
MAIVLIYFLVRSNAAALNLLAATKFNLLEDTDIHVHVNPSDLTKEGPSVGITIATALVSLFSNRGVRPDTAMTGEISLKGEVLAVGCIKEKIKAAHDYGIKRVILPESNMKDLEEVPSYIRGSMERDTRESGVKVAEEEYALLSPRKAKPLPLAEEDLEIDSYGNCSNLLAGKSIGLTCRSSGGGLVIHVDTLKFGGKGDLQRTGLLRPFMFESIAVALSWVRSNAAALNLLAATKFNLLEDTDIHVHVHPSDLTKEGPSVGIAIATALVSLFSNRGVRPDTAMTGEISLKGEVLAVGCIKETIKAAHDYGIKRVILPESNMKELEEVPSYIRRSMERDTRESGVKVAKEEYALQSPRKAKPLPLAEEDMEIDSYGNCSNLLPGKSIGLTCRSSGGGLVIHVDTLKFGGKGDLQRTGLLGPFMFESIAVALSWVRSNAAALNLLAATKFNLLEDTDIHVHVHPSDLTKEGPSVGIAIATALVSLFSNRGVRPDTSMTGEISLKGEVLAVGCIKEKIKAAHDYGIKRVILPESNMKDLEEVPSYIRRSMEILSVAKMEDVLKHAFE